MITIAGINLELTDLVLLTAAFAICIGFGVALHIAWTWDKKPIVSLLDLWQASGAKERAEFVVSLCKSHASLVCGTLKNIRKCKHVEL